MIKKSPSYKIEKRKKHLKDIVAENEKALLRSFILGNAGGTIATLSLIGTIIGSSDHSRFDRGALYILIAFLVGLTFGAIARFAELRWADAESWMLNFEPEDEESIGATRWADNWKRIKLWAFRLSGTLLAIGIVAGLFQLWCFTK